jgi:hypothetical protein
VVRFLFFILLAGVMQSCASPKDLYRVSYVRWVGDSVELQVVDKHDPPRPVAGLETEFECLNCNLYLEPWEKPLDANGKVAFQIPEARQLVSTRIAVRANGIDTPAVLHQREPEQATAFYRLAQPLTGRLLVTSLSLLYFDSTFDSVAIAVDLQDELNLYSEEPDHFVVHHPYFPQPLYLRKLGVVRVR